MKKLLVLFTCLILMGTACKKSKSPTGITAPTSSPINMTALETSMVGKWYLDKLENWSGDTLISTINASNTPGFGGSYMELKSSMYAGTYTAPQFYDCFSHTSAQDIYSYWQIIVSLGMQRPMIQGPTLFAAGGEYIDSISVTNLILVEWQDSIKSGKEYYFHK